MYTCLCLLIMSFLEISSWNIISFSWQRPHIALKKKKKRLKVASVSHNRDKFEYNFVT